MNKPLTPAQAFEHIKALWPDTVKIVKWHKIPLKVSVLPSDNILNLLIDWGNTTEFPLPKKWRDATIHDIVYPFKEAIFTDNETITLNEWYNGELTSVGASIVGASIVNKFTWMDTCGEWWKFCKVLADDGQPISTYPGEVLLLMGGVWKKGSRSNVAKIFWSDKQSGEWDAANQPTRWKPLPDDWKENVIDEGDYDDEDDE